VPYQAKNDGYQGGSVATADEIIATVDRILVDQFELGADQVVPHARLREDLDLDSLDAADMMIAIEKRFGVRLDDNVARSFTTVEDIHSYVRKLVLEKEAAEA
jgi:acyl carrier protein